MGSRALDLVVGAEDNKHSKAELSMAAERAPKSGRAEEEATVSIKRAEEGGGRPSRPSIRGAEQRDDSKKAYSSKQHKPLYYARVATSTHDFDCSTLESILCGIYMAGGPTGQRGGSGLTESSASARMYRRDLALLK